MAEDQRPRGPWDPAPGETVATHPTGKEYRLGPVGVRFETSSGVEGEARPLDKGQHPAWAIVSTALLAGLIWYVSGSWIVATAVIFGLFVHEYGHVLAMNRYGMGPARIYIIPFFGGLARGQRPPASEWEGVKMSLAGPAFGLLATLPFFGLWLVTGWGDWLLGAFAIAMINLVNLAPAPPLDGSKALGPVLAKIHPGVEKIAMVVIGLIGVAWGIWTGFYFLAVVMGIALFGTLKRGLRPESGRLLSAREAWVSTGLFVVSLAACAGVAVAALMPLAGSIEGAVTFGLNYLGIRL